MCSRCHKFEEAEKVIIKICSELCKQHDICMEIDQTAKRALNPSENEFRFDSLLSRIPISEKVNSEVKKVLVSTLPKVLLPSNTESTSMPENALCVCSSPDLDTDCCIQCGGLQDKPQDMSRLNQCHSRDCPNPDSSQSLTPECAVCKAQFHRHPDCLGLNKSSPSLPAALSSQHSICSLCRLKLHLSQVSRLTAGKAEIIKIEFDAVRFNMHAELYEIQSIAQERISQEELRTRILDYLSQQQVHWSTAADIIRTCPATFSTKAEAVFTGLMPMVGWAGGVPVMRQNAVLSLQFDRQVEDDIISFAFGMLCAQIHPFKSELHAAHIAPLAINEWLYCNEDILRKRARIGQDSELQYALRYVDLLLIPVNIRDSHWHLMIADRNHKVIHYFDPLHLRRPVFKGNPTGAAHKLKCYISEYAKNDHLCGFSDIEKLPNDPCP